MESSACQSLGVKVIDLASTLRLNDPINFVFILSIAEAFHIFIVQIKASSFAGKFGVRGEETRISD